MKKSDWNKKTYDERWSAENVADAMMSVLDKKPVKWEEDSSLGEPSEMSVRFHGIEEHASSKILNELSALGDQLELMAWNIGWLTDKLYRNLIANKQDVDYLFVCFYVSVKCLKGNRKMNTVKDYALVARFFPPKIAKKYMYDILPFSHFRYAMTFGDMCAPQTKIPVWQMVLDWSWQCYQDSPVSRFVTVKELRAKFEGGLAPERKAGHIPNTGGFVPPVSSAIYMSDIPMPSLVSNAPTDMITSIVHGVIQNFTMAISNYIPALTKAKPEVGHALAGVLHNLEVIAGKLEE